MSVESWHHLTDEVRLMLGNGVYLRLPAPPDGDAYDHKALVAALNGCSRLNPEQFLLSYRKRIYPEG